MILKSKTTYDVIFFSPHLDDAILSASGLMNLLLKRKKRILVVTLFSSGNDTTFSESALLFLKNSGQSKKSSFLFKNRRNEDIRATKKIGINHKHFSFVDALFRKNSSNRNIYQNFDQIFSGKVSNDDKLLVTEIEKKILFEIQPVLSKKCLIFAPLGVGTHVDHILTNQIIRSMFKDVQYWQDVPYDSEYLKVIKRLSNLEDENYHFKKNVIDISNFSKIKLTAVEYYKSQIEGLYKAGLQPQHFFQEIIYINNDK